MTQVHLFGYRHSSNGCLGGRIESYVYPGCNDYNGCIYMTYFRYYADEVEISGWSHESDMAGS